MSIIGPIASFKWCTNLKAAFNVIHINFNKGRHLTPNNADDFVAIDEILYSDDIYSSVH
jgi:hypothetical protein